MMPRWWALSRGDLDTTIAQVGFNLAQMVIPVFLLLPVGISAGFSVTHLLPGYRARVSDRLARPGASCRAPGQARRPRGCHRARLRQQRARDHRLHALHHAAGVSGNARCQSRLGDRRGGGGVDRNHQTRGGAFRPSLPPIHSRSGRDDGVRRGHVQLSGAGSVAARFRSAAGRPDRARHYLHQRLGQHSDHALAHSAVHRRLDHPAAGRAWQLVMCIPSGPDSRSSFPSPARRNLCAP